MAAAPARAAGLGARAEWAGRAAPLARWEVAVERTLAVLAGIVGASGVALGAFGAHGLSGRLEPRAMELWATAARYHLIHAAALLGAAWVAGRWPGAWAGAGGVLLVAGTVVFSGTVYALALGAPRWLGAVTPAGGLALIAGWAALAVAAARGGR